MSKSELRGKCGRDLYYSPVEHKTRRTSKKIKNNQYSVEEELDAGPSRLKSRRAGSHYQARIRLLSYKVFNKMMLAQNGRAWSDVYSEFIQKCKGAFQKELMKERLLREKVMYDDSGLGLYKDENGVVFANSKSYRPDPRIWYVDEAGFVRVVRQKPMPKSPSESLILRKTTFLEIPGQDCRFFVKEKGVWFVVEGHKVASSTVHCQNYQASLILNGLYRPDLLQDHSCFFYHEKYRSWITLVSKKSANSKEVALAEQLAKAALEAI